MPKTTERKRIDRWDTVEIAAGETKNVALTIGESYRGTAVEIPIQVRRAKKDGPTLFVTGALHGDELNGTGIVRQLIREDDIDLKKGNLILVPVLNFPAFERYSRYMPDRRDLNRCFPGTEDGSFASRMAKTLFDEIVGRSDFGIDLHTAAIRRTNYPTVRGDLSDDNVARIAQAFGCEIILDQKGPKGSFRKEATNAGCPTIVVEGGEVWKVEPTIVETGMRGVKNVLRELEMLDGERDAVDNQVRIKKSKWIRAERGGFLEFHVIPGEIVENDQPLATSTNLLGEETFILLAPFDGVVIGMTTLPAISPGEPICHIGQLPKTSQLKKLESNRSESEALEGRLVENLASSIMVVDPTDED